MLPRFVPLLLAAGIASAQPSVRVILVGDSTVALKNGWGPGFCADLTAQAACINMAKNGRSTRSYRAEGSWAEVLAELKESAAFKETYVLIQFGHNDQPGKASASDLATEFPENLRRYVREVSITGAHPVLITPLSRRTFQAGTLKDDLGAWGAAAKRVAYEESVPVLDLNTDSAAAVQKMGAVEANTLAMVPPPEEITEAARHGNSPPAPKEGPYAQFDYTHLGDKGSAFFGRMVADELRQAVPDLRPYIRL